MAIALHPLGISTDPQQVIVGRDGWLYLGDSYESTRTVDRRSASEADIALGREIGHAVEAWDLYLATQGVKLFRVMIGPNKGSIYPEHLPNWAKPASPNATDALLAGTGNSKYIDLRKPLLKAKKEQQADLYYKTDTHWNHLGAAVAFQEFAQQSKSDAPEIKWLEPKDYAVIGINPRIGGDLANFLRLSDYFSDQDPIISALQLPIKTIHTDFDTKQVLYQGGNPSIGAPQKPLLVQSIDALNKKKVLWLRDSFGVAMSPLMAVIFSDVLQIHWGEAIKPGGRLIQLVEEWKPDYVFFTVVERGARNKWFTASPPAIVFPKEDSFKPQREVRLLKFNDISEVDYKNQFKINGEDPFFDFSISDNIKPSETRYLNIDFTCNDRSESIPVQIFWLESGISNFDEDHSQKIILKTGNNLIDLKTLVKLSKAESISRIRFDIDAKNSCAIFQMKAPIFGINSR